MHTTSTPAKAIASNGSGAPMDVITDAVHPIKHHRRLRTSNDIPGADRWIYRMVVVALGLTVVISVVGGIVLGIAGQTIPDGVVALGSAALGGLAGLLVPSPHR